MDKATLEESCLICGATAKVLLGYLGRVAWFRCRHCGAENAVEETADQQED